MALALHTPAPDFTANTDGGDSLTLSNFKGQRVVLYFYPKDNTSGCTQQACDFRDNMERISSHGVTVIGVSPDNVKKHNKFKADFALNFKLVSDEDKSICEAYGVWAEKSMYGRKYMGVERTTFIIDAEGVITHIFPKVKVPGHVDAVIAALEGR
jgi:peroxiredoxin Q/BCP